MTIKWTWKEKWKVFIGKPYLLNTNTAEVHFLPNKTKDCWIPMMHPAHKVYLSEKQFQQALSKGYQNRTVNGCKWCLKKHDTG